jgi:hypothetical protein
MGFFNRNKEEEKPETAPEGVKCSLCSSSMKIEKNFYLQDRGPGIISYKKAYVCNNCKAVFPIKPE